MPYWSIIKYKPKDGCEDEFLKQAEHLENLLGDGERLDIWLKTCLLYTSPSPRDA